MIISFHGTQKRGHNVGAIAVFTAAIEAFRTNKKTCMISLRNNIPGENIENYAIPGEGTSDDMLNNFSFSDIGIDGLLRRAEIGRLQPEQFDNCVTPLVREKNGFDITRATKDTRLEEALSSKWQFVEEILATANRIYDYVFVYIGSTDNDVVQKMNALSDRVVLVVRQGKAEPFPEADKDPAVQKKLCLLVTDFETDSVWNFKHIKTEYNIKKNIFTMPHNVKFRDAREDGGLVRFAMKNINPNRSDYNSFLIYSMKRLLKFCDGNEPDVMAQYTPKYEGLDDPLYKDIPPVKVLEPYAAQATTEVITEKAGLFSRPKQKTVVKLTEDTSQEVVRESDRNLVWKPTDASEQAVKLQKQIKAHTEIVEQIAMKQAAGTLLAAPAEEPEENPDDDYDKMFRFGGQDDDDEDEDYEESAVEEEIQEEEPEEPVVKPVAKPVKRPVAPTKPHVAPAKPVEHKRQEVEALAPVQKKVVKPTSVQKKPAVANKPVAKTPVQTPNKPVKPVPKTPAPVVEKVPVAEEKVTEVIEPTIHKGPFNQKNSQFKFKKVASNVETEQKPAAPVKPIVAPVVEKVPPVKEEISESVVTEEDDDFSFDIPSYDETKDIVNTEENVEEDKEALPEGFEHVDETPFDEDNEDVENETDLQVEEDEDNSEVEDTTEEELDEGTEDDFFAEDDTEEDSENVEEEETEEPVEEKEASEDDFFAADDENPDEADDYADGTVEDESFDEDESYNDEEPDVEDDFSDTDEDEYDPILAATLDDSDDEYEESDDDFSDPVEDDKDVFDTDDENNSYEDSEDHTPYTPKATFMLKDADEREQMYDEEDTEPVKVAPKKEKISPEFAWLMDETGEDENDSYENEDESYDDESYNDEYQEDANDNSEEYEYVDDSESYSDDESYDDDVQNDLTDDSDSYDDAYNLTADDEKNIMAALQNVQNDDDEFGETEDYNESDVSEDEVQDDVDSDDSCLTEDLIRKVADLYDDGYRLDMIAKMVQVSEDTVREIKKLSRTISDDYHDGFRLDKIAKRNGISVELAEALNDTAKKFA